MVPSKTSPNRDTKIISMDLETILINNKHIPYLLSWYDGNITKSYFIDSIENNIENNIENMISRAMNDICIRKYKNYKVYLHNFAKFDGYFLVKYLSKLGFIDNIIINKGRIITLKFIYNKYSITFKDSYLLLPSSLRKLCKSFNTQTQKDIFPYLLDDINYIGEVPDYKYFCNLEMEEYNNYKSNFKVWNFREEAIKYCNLDCISLYEILYKFNTLVFNKFELNINKYPTLPSLSFALFKTKYLKENEVHMLSGSIATNIRKSYTGGSVDMYIPLIEKDSKIFIYDINSLYPFSMKSFKFPIGNPTFFKGDITRINKDAFGFFYCKIITPEYLEHPILQTHLKTSDGIRTLAPLGSWEDMLFSEEMYNAMKYGYKFEILWGYTFESKNIFSEIISDLYKMRLEYQKSDPMNYIAKILMNSLYGRFGMDDNFTFSDIMDKDDYFNFEKLDRNNSILDVTELNNNNFLVTTKNPKVELDTILDNGSEKHDINIAIASAITAYSRIQMSKFKNNPNFKLFYSDTDSVYISKELPEELVSNTELGKMKKEGICDDAVFLAPKVYGYKDINGKATD
uniref:DNA polymerase n=1 Tax=Cyclocybe aegerita TaxID=1973307 RepID=O78938_CYCAE|nr:B type DNA polymerase [Cyclocybe aegerita]